MANVKKFKLHYSVKPFIADSRELYDFVCKCTEDFVKSVSLVGHYRPWMGMKAEIKIHPENRSDARNDIYTIAIHCPTEEWEILSKMFPTVREYHCDFCESMERTGSALFDPIFQKKWRF